MGPIAAEPGDRLRNLHLTCAVARLHPEPRSIRFAVARPRDGTIIRDAGVGLEVLGAGVLRRIEPDVAWVPARWAGRR